MRTYPIVNLIYYTEKTVVRQDTVLIKINKFVFRFRSRLDACRIKHRSFAAVFSIVFNLDIRRHIDIASVFQLNGRLLL